MNPIEDNKYTKWFKLLEAINELGGKATIQEIKENFTMLNGGMLQYAIECLIDEGYLSKVNGMYKLTFTGKNMVLKHSLPIHESHIISESVSVNSLKQAIRNLLLDYAGVTSLSMDYIESSGDVKIEGVVETYNKRLFVIKKKIVQLISKMLKVYSYNIEVVFEKIEDDIAYNMYIEFNTQDCKVELL